MKAMLVEVGKAPHVVSISQSQTLKDMQGHVQGLVEPLSIPLFESQELCIFVNEEGILQKMEPNRAIYATKLMEEKGYLSQINFSPIKKGDLYTILFGPVLILAYGEEGKIRSMTEAEVNEVVRYFDDPLSGVNALMSLA